MKLVIATTNQHKKNEIQNILTQYQIHVECVSLSEIDFSTEIIEDALTFEGNAIKKAKTVGLQTFEWVLADDSGLCVDALGGNPGIYSARYAGNAATDEQNNQKLIKTLQGVQNRHAYYACALALYHHHDRLFVTQGKIIGEIIDQPEGKNGFGYDPHFYVPQAGCTMASLSSEDKNLISHRTEALRAMIPHLHNIAGIQ
ncbi:MAG: RdgB/HAM1 family non-canonical purine NTP pyrophosphatase [Bdellovibrionales bacterium]|nr:RdgB/HAM1 family non-canonical purine NTP pyrophosphatase [Bdellovibrionales bacterium]